MSENAQPEVREPEVALFGSPQFIVDRATMFREFLFKEHVFGLDAAAYIAHYCEESFERARLYSRKAQGLCGGDEDKLAKLAATVKYINAHLNLAKCYGEQIGIMTEHQLFRAQALSYMSLVQAEIEVLEYYDPDFDPVME